tara:strand:+ start:2139 stop:2240 length:102 start_codon:yes stop_codon:yes gene_type:complete
MLGLMASGGIGTSVQAAVAKESGEGLLELSTSS